MANRYARLIHLTSDSENLRCRVVALRYQIYNLNNVKNPPSLFSIVLLEPRYALRYKKSYPRLTMRTIRISVAL